jgi:hypothetical protein
MNNMRLSLAWFANNLIMGIRNVNNAEVIATTILNY